MRANIKVHKSIVDRFRIGLKARVWVDALPQEVFTGTVQQVQPLPDPTTPFGPKIKIYTSLITIDEPHARLRPGMTIRAEVLVKQLDNVLTVPVGAVLQRGGKDHVAVQTTDGSHEWRAVVLGATNGTLVEIKEGLRSGESVVLDPRALSRKD